jgi:hypothetical protein
MQPVLHSIDTSPMTLSYTVVLTYDVDVFTSALVIT